MTSLLERLRARDTSLWPEGSAASYRLGWLDIPTRMQAEAEALASWAAGIEQSRIVLLGMGGSSLGPEVLRSFAGSDRLVVLDTTDPRTVASVELDDAFFVVSSKSGSTLEVQVLLAHAWSRVPDPSRYAAITDPGTSFHSLASERGFSRIFVNPPDIGGRYSVLSYFGLVPAALLGYDVAELCRRALDTDAQEAVELGVAMAEAAQEGRDKVTIRTAPSASAFGLWVEQLVAESTGKGGRGCIPVPTTEAEEGPDRFLLALHLGDAYDLGAEFYRWQVATAIAGHILGVDPFDEPNVTESKLNTRRVLESLPLSEGDLADPNGVFEWLAATVREGDYVSLQAYLPYGQDDALETLRRRVRDRLGGMAVTVGYGPRFLHSTGQLHKGGPNSVVAVQIVPLAPTAKLEIPNFPYDFATLIAAQAAGDYQSLVEHGRRVLRVGADHLQEVN
ncbi:MAG: glucose-6-phosphate isomerase [Actinobacteria bacterium]|nr:glucose-6-phosphate isomerase [Actinomycetota bacterium]